MTLEELHAHSDGFFDAMSHYGNPLWESIGEAEPRVTPNMTNYLIDMWVLAPMADMKL